MILSCFIAHQLDYFHFKLIFGNFVFFLREIKSGMKKVQEFLETKRSQSDKLLSRRYIHLEEASG